MKIYGDHFRVGIISGSIWGSVRGWGSFRGRDHFGGCTGLPDNTILHYGNSFFLCTVFSKPTILHHPQNVSVYLEDKAIMVIFTCEASGFPRPEITWVKNNSTVASGTVAQNGSISSLVLRLAERKEAPGKFKCVVKNSLGEVSSKEGALIIRTRIHSLGEKSMCSNIQVKFF